MRGQGSPGLYKREESSDPADKYLNKLRSSGIQKSESPQILSKEQNYHDISRSPIQRQQSREAPQYSQQHSAQAPKEDM